MDKVRHVPSLQGLQALVAVSDSGSFTQAAQVLCLTQSAVSRQIQQLESHFGMPLLARTSRSLRVTAEGEQVLASARTILAQLKTLEDRISPNKRPFRIRLHVSLAVRWLLPRLSDFYRLHPDTSLAIETVATEVVEPASDSDAYIQYLPKPPNDSACLTLFEEQLVPVCAPGLGAMATMEDLLRQTLLHRSVDKHDWRVWLAAHSAGTLDDYRHIPFNLDELALDAAARGLGVAMTDLTLACESIDRGILVVPLGQPLATGGVYALCLQPMGASHPGSDVVMEWFGRQAQR
jgi:LysR family glycine cleavage system transcriptional activator